MLRKQLSQIRFVTGLMCDMNASYIQLIKETLKLIVSPSYCDDQTSYFIDLLQDPPETIGRP